MAFIERYDFLNQKKYKKIKFNYMIVFANVNCWGLVGGQSYEVIRKDKSDYIILINGKEERFASVHFDKYKFNKNK
jgi:hypothetical protein